MGYAEGTDRNQTMILSLEDMVDERAMVRVIDRFIEVTDFVKLGFDKTVPAATGRPPYSPKAMAKLYLYGYENGVRSSRRLEKEAARNVEVMWLMNCLRPDHKTIAEFRRSNIRPLQKLFREFVRLCKSWDLIEGSLIAVDGTKIKASNNKKMNYSRKKLDARLAHIDEQIKSYLADIEASDLKAGEPQATETLNKLLERKELYEAYKEQLVQNGENELSVVDPDARLMGNNRGGVDMAYNVQSAVDGKNDIIIEYDVSMNPSDQHQLSSMVKKVTRKLRLKKFTVLADKGYYNGTDLLKLKRLKVKAVVSKQKPSDSKELPAEFRSEKFMYNEKTDTYICPKAQELRPHNKKDAKRRNYFNKSACGSCAHAEECVTGNRRYRTVTRSQYSKIYEETDRLFAENLELYKRRQQIVEHPFGTVKHTMHGGQFLLRTRRKVCGEVALLFLGYNLKRALNVLGFEGLMTRLNSLLRNFLRSMGMIRINA